MLDYYELLFMKEKYIDHDIIYLNLHGNEWVFRTLTRREYQVLLRLAEDEDTFEDRICQQALIYPEGFDFEYSPFAGLAKEASSHIVQASGFSDIEQVFDFYDQAKAKNTGFEIECMNVIKAAMPEYTYEEMEDWTWRKLMDYVSRAERVLELRGIEGIKLERSTPDEESESISVENHVFVADLLKRGIDPMLYFKDQVKPRKAELVEFPLIGGVHWQNEEVLDAIRQQMAKQNS